MHLGQSWASHLVSSARPFAPTLRRSLPLLWDSSPLGCVPACSAASCVLQLPRLPSAGSSHERGSHGQGEGAVCVNTGRWPRCSVQLAFQGARELTCLRWAAPGVNCGANTCTQGMHFCMCVHVSGHPGAWSLGYRDWALRHVGWEDNHSLHIL